MRWKSFLSACLLILRISNAARPEPTSLLHGNLKADLRPDAADPKKKSTDHMMPVADEGKEEKKEETKEEKEEKEEKKSTEHAVADEEEKKEEKKDDGKCIPIPGAAKKTKPKGKFEKCVDGDGFGCKRGCKYLVEDDECGDCKGHNVSQPNPEEQIQDYQKRLRPVRIPKAMDSIGYVWGCKKKNTVQCYDQDRKKHCCCNLGFIFDFFSRQCVADTEDKTNKEDPIPGSQLWSKSKGPSGKCLTKPSKYCCHRSCTYELDEDKCGRCLSYEETPPSTEHKIIDWQNQHSNIPYVIPRSICKPNSWAKFWKRGKCDLEHSSKCDEESMKDHCCCKQGLVFSFETRKCVTRAALKEEEDREYKAMQEQDQALAAKENNEGPPPDPQVQTYQQPAQSPQQNQQQYAQNPQSPQQNQQQYAQQNPQSPQQNPQADKNGGGGNGETTKMLVKTGLKASGMGSAATHSLALVVPILTLSMIRGLI